MGKKGYFYAFCLWTRTIFRLGRGTRTIFRRAMHAQSPTYKRARCKRGRDFPFFLQNSNSARVAVGMIVDVLRAYVAGEWLPIPDGTKDEQTEWIASLCARFYWAGFCVGVILALAMCWAIPTTPFVVIEALALLCLILFGVVPIVRLKTLRERLNMVPAARIMERRYLLNNLLESCILQGFIMIPIVISLSIIIVTSLPGFHPRP